MFGTKRTKRIEIAASKKNKKQKKTSIFPAANEKSSNANDEIAKKALLKSNNIDRMSLSKLTEGSLALGYVLQVNPTNLVVSLPGGLTGTGILLQS